MRLERQIRPSDPARMGPKKCFNCGSYDHLAALCPQPRRAPPKPQKAKVNEVEECEEGEENGMQIAEADAVPPAEEELVAEEYDIEYWDGGEEDTFDCLPIV